MGLHHQLLACQRPTYLTAGSLSHGCRLALHFDIIAAAKSSIAPGYEGKRDPAGDPPKGAHGSAVDRHGRVGSIRWVSVVLRHAWVVVVPGLGTFHENVGIGFKPARIVQRADAKTDKVGASPDLHIQRRATVAAEDTDDVVAAVGLRDIAFWFALEDAEPRTRDARSGYVGSAALALAVAAMAAQGEDRLARCFVTN